MRLPDYRSTGDSVRLDSNMRSRPLTIQESTGTINETSRTPGTKPMYPPETYLNKQGRDLQRNHFDAKVEKEISITQDHSLHAVRDAS